VRIAVHPAVRRRGLGRALVKRVCADSVRAELDLLGASFGATPDLLRFWRDCGLQPAQVGTSRNAASGAHAAVVLAGLSAAGHDLVRLARAVLAERLPGLLAGPLRDLEPDIAFALLSTGTAVAPTFDQRAWKELAAFAHAARPFESVIVPLGRLAAAGLALAPPPISAVQGHALVAATLQLRDPSAVAVLIGAGGRGDVIATLRAATRDLMAHFAPPDQMPYLRALTAGPGGG
jgi:tRNA(Met) cytidine acetyltransferase